MQAVNLDLDLVRKLGMVTGQVPAGGAKAPKTKAEEDQALRKLGIKIGRQKNG